MAKRKKNRKAVLVTSCVMAALIVASSSFAWFTSKDEVTNRLSANADYGVAVAEDFTPPENLLPGQVVNKDVGVVNTGNIDAFVKVHLTGAMNILKENAVASEKALKYTAATSGASPTLSSYALPESTTFTNTTDEKLVALGLTRTDGTGNYYRTLSTVERANPALSNSSNNTSANDDNKYSEVKSVQAGGYLAYATGAFKFTPENAGYTYIAADGTTTVVQTTPTEVASTAINNTWNTGVGLEIDADTFVPTSSGLFIFRRNVTEDATSGTYYEYSGYYYDADNSLYYALHYLPNEGGTPYNSDYVIYSTKETAEQDGNALTVTYETAGDIKTPVVSVLPTQVKLFSASYTRIENISGVYDQGTESGGTVTKAPTVTFAYDGGTSGTGATTDDDIKVTVNLDNVGKKAPASGSEGWTQLAISNVPYFYYNNDVEEGDTTSKLVDSVELDKDTKKSAYLAFDFDLSVLLDSVQVTYAENGNEKIDAANAEWTEVTGTATLTENEISSIAWATT